MQPDNNYEVVIYVISHGNKVFLHKLVKSLDDFLQFDLKKILLVITINIPEDISVETNLNYAIIKNQKPKVSGETIILCLTLTTLNILLFLITISD